MTPDTGRPITLVLATDSPLMGDGLASLFAHAPEVEMLGRALDLPELLQLVDTHIPDAVILAIRTQPADRMITLETASKLRANHPELGIVIISDHRNGLPLALLRGGAFRIACLLDGERASITSIVNALEDLRSGHSVLDPTIVEGLVRRDDGLTIDGLTTREMDVLEQVAHGMSNRAAAHALHLSVKTIEKSVTVIFRKLGLEDASVIDRRATAGLIYQQAQTGSFPSLPINPKAQPRLTPT
ncbi:MAG: response regulator transcription factor [Mycobacteriales bacterium]